MGFKAVEFDFEVFHVALFPFPKGALTGARLSGFRALRWKDGWKWDGSYAALFCAFRRLWAGVRLSFSSSLLRPCA